MPTSRHIVVQHLQQVLQGRSLTDVLTPQNPSTDARDSAFIAELTYGVCRWYAQLQAIVDARLRKPLRRKDQDIYLLLLLGAYQLGYSRIPTHAVLSTSVEMTRTLDKAWASKLVNAVLRGLQRDLEKRPQVIQKTQQRDLATRYAQPAWLTQAIVRDWSDDHQQILAALQQRAPMTLRLNRRHLSVEDYLARLAENNISAQQHGLAPDAIVLDQPMPVALIPGFNAGLVSVQDAGAQLAAHLLDISSGQRILDACAAPGGKTGHALELADDLDVTATDIDPIRLKRVEDNLARLQLSAKLVVTDAAKPPSAWQKYPFDRILVDAPCSAIGVMRRHPDIRLLRRASDIPALVKRQTALLKALWPCLAPGGKMLYATCSILAAENKDVVASFLQTQPDAQVASMPDALKLSSWGQPTQVGQQVLPGDMHMDGFYYALLTKTTRD